MKRIVIAIVLALAGSVAYAQTASAQQKAATQAPAEKTLEQRADEITAGPFVGKQ